MNKASNIGFHRKQTISEAFTCATYTSHRRHGQCLAIRFFIRFLKVLSYELGQDSQIFPHVYQKIPCRTM